MDLYEKEETEGSEGGYPIFPNPNPSVLRKVMNRYNLTSTIIRFSLRKPLIEDTITLVKWYVIIKLLLILP
jgi:hypothetical protein